MEEEKRFNPAKFEILKEAPVNVTRLLFLEEREIKPLPFEALPEKVRDLFQERQVAKIVSYNQKVLILTPEGLKEGKRKFEELSERLASLLQNLGQREAKFFPFGSLAREVWVGGTEEKGLAIDPLTGEILDFKSDFDIGILIEKSLSSRLKEVINGESTLPEKYADLLEEDLHVRIVNPRQKGVLVYSLFLEQRSRLP